jgi:hypothetical protein
LGVERAISRRQYYAGDGDQKERQMTTTLMQIRTPSDDEPGTEGMQQLGRNVKERRCERVDRSRLLLGPTRYSGDETGYR